MKNYVVMVEGKNLAICFPGKAGGFSRLFGKKKAVKKVGFFATRFTVANTASDAGMIVVDAVKRELESQWKIENLDSDPPIFLISEVRQADSAESGLTVRGFTFYDRDERH
jgi:hypothetical protein